MSHWSTEQKESLWQHSPRSPLAPRIPIMGRQSISSKNVNQKIVSWSTICAWLHVHRAIYRRPSLVPYAISCRMRLAVWTRFARGDIHHREHLIQMDIDAVMHGRWRRHATTTTTCDDDIDDIDDEDDDDDDNDDMQRWKRRWRYRWRRRCCRRYRWR